MFLLRRNIFVKWLARRSWYVVTSSWSNLQNVPDTAKHLRQVIYKMFLICSNIFVKSLARRSWYVVTSSPSNFQDVPDTLKTLLQVTCKRRALLNDNGLHGLYGLYGLYGPYGPYGPYGLYRPYGPYGYRRMERFERTQKFKKRKWDSPDLSGRQQKMLIHTISNKYAQRSKKHLSITQMAKYRA